MSKKAAVLGDRGVVSVSGADAAGFLQGLLTNDIEGLEPGEARYAALLTPQGKILFDMIVVRAPDADGAAYLLDCAVAQAPELARRLGFYKLRAKVTIADVSAGRAVAAFWGDEPAAIGGALIYADPRDRRLGWRAILPRPTAGAIGAEHVNEYEGLRIGAVAPTGGLDFAYGDAFPHDVNLDLLHGVDFDKGCYVGQEVEAPRNDPPPDRARQAGRAAAGAGRARRGPRACRWRARLVVGARSARASEAGPGRGRGRQRPDAQRRRGRIDHRRVSEAPPIARFFRSSGRLALDRIRT
jgi:hypothetical protein